MKKTNTKNKIRVFVGLSGGVDSALSATLLKKQGFDVTGVFIKAWSPEGFPCTWKEDRRSAMRVCAILDIPFLTLDLEKEYKKEVVDYMIAEYKIGRTPNPDVMCNKEIKFGHFLKFALKNGADFVATGHYARIFLPTQSRKDSLPKVLGSPVARLNQTFVENFSGLLAEGLDKNKDQSYFLWTLTQDQLKHILFPIGHLQKPEVRKLAEKFKLPQATRKDSQGLCFLGKINMKEFLAQYIPQKKGDVLLENGEIIGHHNGALFFTIGERHGFTITKKTENEVPFYVTSKNIEKNTITVSSKSRSIGKFRPLHPAHISGRGPHGPKFTDATQHTKFVILENINIISKIPNKKISCRIRYRQEKVACEVEKIENKLKVTFEKPQEAVSPGQSLVFYDKDICLGGGVIL